MSTFIELLDNYLELKNSNEMEHPGHIAGYTNKGYYEDLTEAEEKLNALFPSSQECVWVRKFDGHWTPGCVNDHNHRMKHLLQMKPLGTLHCLKCDHLFLTSDEARSDCPKCGGLLDKAPHFQKIRKMRFKDLPVGARFKYPDGDDVWIAVEMFGIGNIAKWNGLSDRMWQSRCCFVDEEWSLESEVEVIE